MDQALNECFVELIRIPNQAAITNKAVNLTPTLSPLPEFLQHDQQYRRAVHQLNQKALLPAPLRLYRVDFTGIPEMRDGYLYLNGKPGIGVDIDEKAAAEYPCSEEVVTWDWMLPRLPDGTAVRP